MDSGRDGAGSKPAGFDPFRVPERIASASPEPHAPGKQRRWHRWLSDHAGLTSLGVNLTRILPGAQAPRHHRHSGRDEFIYVLSGEIVLKTDAGEG